MPRMCREEIPAQILAGKRLFPNAADGVEAKDGLVGTVFGGGNNEGPLSGIIGDWLRISRWKMAGRKGGKIPKALNGGERPSSPTAWRINHTLFFLPDAECKSEVTMANALVNNPGSLNTIHS